MNKLSVFVLKKSDVVPVKIFEVFLVLVSTASFSKAFILKNWRGILL